MLHQRPQPPGVLGRQGSQVLLEVGTHGSPRAAREKSARKRDEVAVYTRFCGVCPDARHRAASPRPPWALRGVLATGGPFAGGRDSAVEPAGPAWGPRRSSRVRQCERRRDFCHRARSIVGAMRSGCGCCTGLTRTCPAPPCALCPCPPAGPAAHRSRTQGGTPGGAGWTGSRTCTAAGDVRHGRWLEVREGGSAPVPHAVRCRQTIQSVTAHRKPARGRRLRLCRHTPPASRHSPCNHTVLASHTPSQTPARALDRPRTRGLLLRPSALVCFLAPHPHAVHMPLSYASHRAAPRPPPPPAICCFPTRPPTICCCDLAPPRT